MAVATRSIRTEKPVQLPFKFSGLWDINTDMGKPNKREKAKKRRALAESKRFADFRSDVASRTNMDIVYAATSWAWAICFLPMLKYLELALAPKPAKSEIDLELEFPEHDLHILVPQGGAKWDTEGLLPKYFLQLFPSPEWDSFRSALLDPKGDESPPTAGQQVAVLQRLLQIYAPATPTGANIRGLMRHYILQHHQRSPEYLAKKLLKTGLGVPSVRPNMSRQSTLGAVLQPPAKLLEQLADCSPEAWSRYWEAHVHTHLRYSIRKNFITVLFHLGIAGIVLAIAATPTVRDDELLMLNAIDDEYVFVWPSFAKLNSFWPITIAVLYGLVGICALWWLCRSTASQPIAGRAVAQKLLTLTGPGKMISAPVLPSWPGFAAILRLKVGLGLIVGVTEEFEYRFVRVISCMLSLALYDRTVMLLLSMVPPIRLPLLPQLPRVIGAGLFAAAARTCHVQKIQNPALDRLRNTGVHALWLCTVAALCGGVLPVFKLLGDTLDVLTLFQCNALFSSQYNPLMLAAVTANTVHFALMHAYQAVFISEVNSIIDPGTSVGSFSVRIVFACGSKLLPALLFTECALEYGLIVAMLWHGIHDACTFLGVTAVTNAVVRSLRTTLACRTCPWLYNWLIDHHLLCTTAG